LPDPPVWQTDRRTDRRTDGQNCDG